MSKMYLIGKLYDWELDNYIQLIGHCGLLSNTKGHNRSISGTCENNCLIDMAAL